MSPMGRPKSNNPKSNDVKVRLDDNMHYALLKYCDEYKITKAEAIRQGICLLLENDKRK
ncbi:MAG: CopG family transcriptional regulator [Firmicutes bacterium]|nr:CopG family transcriptional regulator [Bacillota bacterium]